MTLARRFKADAANSLNFAAVVGQNVRCNRLAIYILRLVFTKVNAANELTDNDEINSPRNDGFFQRRRVAELRPDLCRAVIGIDAHTRAQTQQALFRAHIAGDAIPLWTANCAEQNAVRRTADIQHLLRQGIAPFVDGAAAHINRLIGKAVAIQRCSLVQHAQRLPDNLRANAVAADNRNLLMHGPMPPSVMPAIRRSG